MSDLNLEFVPDNACQFGRIKNWLATEELMDYCRELSCMWVLDYITSQIQTLDELSSVSYVDWMLVITFELDTTNERTIFRIAHAGDRSDETLFSQFLGRTTLQKPMKFWALNNSSEHKYDPTKVTTLQLGLKY